MLMPSIFGANNMFDDLFDDDFFGERELDTEKAVRSQS